jgi:hypothetical protein
MTVFRLEGDFRKLKATLYTRESIAANIATMRATLAVDYDLFVNKLRGDVARFVEELRQIEPSSPEWS